MLELYSPRIRFGTCKVRPSESTVELNSCGHTTAFYLGKHDLLTVYLGKLAFLSVTDFSLGNLPRENFILRVLDMSRKQ